MTILGLGYGNLRTFAELLDRIHARRITHVIDVRAVPLSPGRAWLCLRTLERGLEAAGIRYRHVKALGNPFRKDPNGLELYRGYLDEFTGASERGTLDVIARAPGTSRIALMCGCAVEALCHRSVLLAYLARSGVEVEREAT